METHFVGKSEFAGGDLGRGGAQGARVHPKAIFFEPIKKVLNLLREFLKLIVFSK